MGISEGEDRGNSLFSEGSFSDSEKWFSKCIWLVEQKHVKHAQPLLAVLYSNRALVYIKMKKWVEAETDCTSALFINSSNTKAKHRRAIARMEMGQCEAALGDVEVVLQV